MSRKLDASIAEALGYQTSWRSKVRRDKKYIYFPCNPSDPCAQLFFVGRKLEELVPKYQADGNAVLKLIMEMQKRGWEVEITSRTAGGYLARFYMLDTTSDVNNIWCHAEKIPNAVALAAYKALTGRKWGEENEPKV